MRAVRRARKAGGFRLTGIQCRCGDLLGQIIEHDLVEVPHRLENEVPEVRPQMVPQRPLAPQFLPKGLEQRAAELLDLIDQERQHHQHGEDHRQVLLAVAIIVFEVVTLVLERVEGFVLDLPATSSTPYQPAGILLRESPGR